jgi:hypothetical protein
MCQPLVHWRSADPFLHGCPQFRIGLSSLHLSQWDHGLATAKDMPAYQLPHSDLGWDGRAGVAHRLRHSAPGQQVVEPLLLHVARGGTL